MTPEGREPGQQVSLPVRLFNSRLDKLEAAIAAGRSDAAEATKTDLRRDLADLPKNNVLVLENQAHLDAVESDNFWSSLDAEGIGFLRSTVAPILRARSDADFKAMRFETCVVEAGTALLGDDEDTFEAMRQSIVEQISELPLTVNVVAREKELIDAAQTEHWWATPTEEKLRSLVDRLAPLMKYRQRRTDPMMKLDIEDLVAVKEWVEFGPEHERMTSSAYRAGLEEYIRGLVAENPVLQKIQTGQEVSEEEIQELASLLERQSLHVTEDILRKVYDNRKAHFIQFIRHILDLEQLESWDVTVTRAFDEFIAAHTTLTALQIRFLQTLRTFILQTGKVEKQALIDMPFTRIHPKGVRGVFRPEEIDEIVAFAEQLVA